MGESSESEEILDLGVVRPVGGRFKHFLSIGDSTIVGIYPLIKDAVQKLGFHMGSQGELFGFSLFQVPP